MKKAWKSLAALPLLACFLQAASSAVSEIPLPEKILPGLDAILRSAVQQSPRMVNQAMDLEAAENDRIAARANLLPSVSAALSITRSQDKYEYLYGPGSTSQNSSNQKGILKTPYSLGLSQPLFFWGERRNNDKIGAIQLKIAQGQYREGYRLLAQELRSGYMRLIIQKLSIKRARFYQQNVNNHLKLQEERLLKKVISEVEISVARLNAEQAQIALDRADWDFDAAKRSFARLSGLNAIGDEMIPDSIPENVYAIGIYDQLLGDFLGQKDSPSSEAYSLRKQIDVASLYYANAKTSLRPKVTGTLGFSQDEQNGYLEPGSKYSLSSTYVGISVSWAIFDGFAAGAATRNSLIARRRLEHRYRQLTEQLTQDAQAAVKQISFSARNMAIYHRLFVSNQGYLNTVRDDFRRGVKSESDVAQVQLNVYDSEISAANARADFLGRICDFLGVLNEDPIVANLPLSK